MYSGQSHRFYPIVCVLERARGVEPLSSRVEIRLLSTKLCARILSYTKKLGERAMRVALCVLRHRPLGQTVVTYTDCVRSSLLTVPFSFCNGYTSADAVNVEIQIRPHYFYATVTPQRRHPLSAGIRTRTFFFTGNVF